MSEIPIGVYPVTRIAFMCESQTLMADIARNSFQHSSLSSWYKSLSEELSLEISQGHSNHRSTPILLGEIGTLHFPFYSMGNVDSSDLFGLDELILFSFYYINRKRYSRILDLGTSIGLHTLVLLKLGYSVTSYEPDPVHVVQLSKVLAANKFSMDRVVEAAASTANGIKQFVRVLGNTTGSHLEGAKLTTPYGGYEKFTVDTKDIREVVADNFDLVKMDVEGHEAVLIAHLESKHFDSTDYLLEVGSKNNASSVYKRVRELGLHAFAQKLNWERVKNEGDIPTSYKEGSLFITASAETCWNA